MGELHRSLYAVIPARVLDDEELRANGKILYGEISSLCQSEGYCWASNAYLATRMKLSPKTIVALIKQLCDRGHLRREVELDAVTREVISRKLWICGPPGSSVPPPLKNEGRYPQIQGDPPLKNEEYNNKSLIIKTKETPYSPPGDKPQSQVKKKTTRQTTKTTADWKPERFDKFWTFYPIKKSRQPALKAWDKLQPSDELISIMAVSLQRMMTMDEQWQRGIGIPHPSSWLNQQRWTDVPNGKVETGDNQTGERMVIDDGVPEW